MVPVMGFSQSLKSNVLVQSTKFPGFNSQVPKSTSCDSCPVTTLPTIINADQMVFKIKLNIIQFLHTTDEEKQDKVTAQLHYC